MSEPKRWLDQDVPGDLAPLVRAARAEQPDSASLRRSLAAVGVGIGAASAAASAKAAVIAAGGTTKVTTHAMGGLLAKWAAVGALGGALAVGVAELATEAPSPIPSSPASPSSTPPRSSRTQPDAPAARDAPSASSFAPPAYPPPESTTTTAAPNAPRLAIPARDHAASSSTTLDADPSPRDADSLAAEVKSIDRARAALSAGKPSQALRLLDEYEGHFQKRRFAPEALSLRMEACVALGRTTEARTVAERLLTGYPDSLHIARARAVISKNP